MHTNWKLKNITQSNKIILQASVHNRFLKCLPDMQFDFKTRSGC